MQAAYALVHLRAGFELRSRRWEVSIYARNVGNREYASGTTNVGPTAFTSRPGYPRQWGTQFTIHY